MPEPLLIGLTVAVLIALAVVAISESRRKRTLDRSLREIYGRSGRQGRRL